MAKGLWTSQMIMSSDDDQPAVEDIAVGFDESMSLVVKIEYTDYEEPKYSNSVSATVSRDDAFELSRRLGVAMKDLPQAISDAVDEYSDIANASFRDVEECFRAITDWLLSNNCHYQLSRKYDKFGHACC